jgi:hypothetical protein
MSRALRYANIVMAVLFLLSAAVQYNDPDPIQWMAIYGVSAAACVAAVRGSLPRPYPAAVAIVALVWALSLAPSVVGVMPARDIFQLRSGAGEEGREMYGLLIVTAWMTLLAFTAHRRRRVSAP